MIQFFIALLVLIASCASSQHTVRYVRPDNSSSSSCPGQPCLTLDQYASQQTKYFTTGTTFLFLAGNHSINTPIILNHTCGVTLKAVDNESEVFVLCKGASVIKVQEVTNFTIQGIAFLLHAEVVKYTYQVMITIIQSKGVSFINSTFLGVQAVNCNYSEIVIAECQFAKIVGGAIWAWISKLTLNRNVFKANAVNKSGSAVYAQKSNLTIRGNVFEENRARHHGGAVAFVESNLIIKENVFDRNTASEIHGGGVVVMKSNLTLKGNIFTRNTAENSGGSIMALSSNATFVGNTFEENIAKVAGGAISAAKGSNITIEKNVFEGNTAGNGGGAVYALASSLNLDGNTFYANKAAVSGGAINLYQSFLLLTDISGGTFVQNFARRTGGAVFCYNSSFFIESNVTDSTPKDVAIELIRGIIFFHNNSNPVYVRGAYGAGGAVDLMYSTFSSNSKHLYFSSNSAGIGSGMSTFESNLTLLSANFTSNSGLGAIIARKGNASIHDFNASGNYPYVLIAQYCNVSFSGDVTISRNYGGQCGGIRAMQSSIHFAGYSVFERNDALLGSAICSLFKSTVSFSGNVLFKNNCAKYDGGAVRADATTTIIMGGNVSFIANRVERNGGAVYFENGAKLLLNHHLSLTLINNHASEHGGALFYKDSPSPEQCAINKYYISDFRNFPSACFILFSKQTSLTTFPYKLTARNNSANLDGSFLFGGLLDKCYAVISSEITELDSDFYLMKIINFYPIFLNITDVQSDTTLAPAISSEAYQLCFCESDEVYSCTDEKTVATHRGKKFSVPLLTLAQGDTVTSSLVRAKFFKSTARLLTHQRLQYLPRNCTNLTFNMFSSQELEQLILYLDESPCLDMGLSRAAINVTFLPCPDGFTLSGDQCVCEERLQKYNANCTIFDDGFYITKNAKSTFWLSTLNDLIKGAYQGLILYPTCPIQYCKTDSAVNISLLAPNAQCAHNRSGLLCGACAANYSLTFGSSTCEACSNTHLALLLVFAAAGIVLVVFLTLLRLTVATGMINSVILYANIVQTNKETLKLSSNSSSCLQVFVAWTNLDFGFQTCFYDGMDAYAQTWLQLAFPIYVWLLISLIILTSRYSMTVTKLIGSNPIAVLATLLLMSYTKLLKIIIEVYSSVDLEYPGNKTVTVWLKDANEPYLESRHLVLTVVTTLLLVFLFLPYTLLLLIGYKLYRFTGRKHTRWLMRIKPLLDSYYAPYKMHTRYWTGFLLLVRCALYIVFSYNSLGHTTQSLLAIIIAFAAIIVWLSVRIYSKFFMNAIEAVVYLNLIVLSASTALVGRLPTVADSLVGMVFIIMMGVIFYHFHIIYIAKSALWLKLRTKMTALRAKQTEANLLLDPVADAAPLEEVPAAIAALPLREPTRSVFFIPQ